MTPILTPDQLDQCVAYFQNGGPESWAAGALTMAPLIFFAFTKKNLPGMVRGLRDMIMTRKNRDETADKK